MPQQDFTGNAKKASLVGTLPASAGAGSVFTVQTGGGAGHPTGALGLPWVETVDRGQPTEEKILCSARNGDNFTISQRGYDGTAVVDHQNNAAVEHTIDAALLKTLSAHLFDTTRDDHTQYARTDGTRVVTGLQKFSAGVDVIGSPSAYSGGELRFDPAQAVAGGQSAVTTNSTGAPRLAFDHRATGNTGDWVWRNGTGAGTVRMQLDAGGTLILQGGSTTTGGLKVGGGVNGYNGEITFGVDLGNGTTYALTNAGTGNIAMFFDQRGPNNNGKWWWRNGTGANAAGALTNRAVLTEKGALMFFGDPTQANFLAGEMGIGYDGTQLNIWDNVGAKGLRFYDKINATTRFAVDGTGKLVLAASTATAATAGTNGAMPAQVRGYLIVNIAGTDCKIPYFNT